MRKTKYLLLTISIFILMLAFSACSVFTVNTPSSQEENKQVIEEPDKTSVEENINVKDVDNPTQIGKISFSYPEEYKLTESSIDTYRTYMFTKDTNTDSDYINVKLYDRDDVQLIKESFKGKDAEYNDIDGVEYTTDTDLYGFAFEEDNCTYIFEATKKEVLENILKSIVELKD